MDQKILDKSSEIFKTQPAVVLAYLFGSQADNTAGKLSDYDFAVYLNLKNNNSIKAHQIKFQLEDRISRVIGSDKIDVVILNSIDKPELAFNIINSGKLFYEKEPFRVLVEPRILNKYFDFRNQLLKFGLTKA